MTAGGTKTAGWLGKLLPDLSQVFGRFPISAMVAVGLWLFLMVSIANGTENDAWEHVQGLIAVFLAAGAGHLFAEGRGGARTSNTMAALVAGGSIAVIYHFYQLFQTSELFLFPGLLLLLLIAPYLRRRADQAALWQFGLRLGLAMLLATIAGIVFGGGLTSIVAALDFLLEVRLPSDAYAYIWGTALGLVAPLYGLSLVPTDLDDEIDIDDHRNTLLERGVSVMVNYVIVPLVVVYALIIHAYAVKIAVTWILPRGEIGTIVSLFAAASVAAWLIAWPWREKGTWLLRQYTRFWFWLIPVPSVLLALAVFRRVADYGITPERYGLGLVVIWTAVLFVYLLFRRRAADMRAVIGVIAALLLAGSFGPWGAHGVTAQSQLGRLKDVFAEAKLPVNGSLDLNTLKLSAEQKQKLYSLIDALGDVDGLAPVVAMLPAKDRPTTIQTRWDRWTLRNELRTKLGVADAWQGATSIVFNAGTPIDLALAPATRLIGPIHAGQAASVPTQPPATWAQIEKGVLNVNGPWGNGSVQAKAIADAVLAAKSEQKTGLILFDIGNGHRIAVSDAYGDTNNPEPLSQVSFWLLLKE